MHLYTTDGNTCTYQIRRQLRILGHSVRAEKFQTIFNLHPSPTPNPTTWFLQLERLQVVVRQPRLLRSLAIYVCIDCRRSQVHALYMGTGVEIEFFRACDTYVCVGDDTPYWERPVWPVSNNLHAGAPKNARGVSCIFRTWCECIQMMTHCR